MWWAKVRLLAPMWIPGPGFAAKKLWYQELLANSENGQSEVRPYDHLAQFWHEFAWRRGPNYAAFLGRVARLRQLQLQSILDLACGAGTVTERLATIAPKVVGLDESEAMLARAHDRCPGVHFVQSDFRDFDLGQQFDAVVCASDSLNYVRDAADLRKVFRCVAAHLTAQGLFVFDTVTERGAFFPAVIITYVSLVSDSRSVSITTRRRARKDRWFISLLQPRSIAGSRSMRKMCTMLLKPKVSG